VLSIYELELLSNLSKRAVNRRARQNKTPNRTEMVRPGESSQDGIMQPTFPLRSSLDNKPYRFIQSAQGTTINNSTTVSTFSSQTVTLSLFNQYTSFTSIFDQYRIALVEVLYLPRANAITAGNVNYGLFATVIDYDDATVLASMAEALDFSNSISAQAYLAQRRVFIPHVAEAAYSGAFTSFANVAAPWIDCSSPNVVHYGVKTAWTTGSQMAYLDVVVKAVIEFRNVR
jgi:hypothetical protein